jgi:hypothetical protein
MSTGPWTSALVLRLALRAVLVLLLLVVGTVPPDKGVADASLEDFLGQTTRRWCEGHGKRDDLQAVLVDVRFRAEPPLFSEGEGVVVAPIAVELPGAQHVLDVESRPAPLRKLRAQGITALAWEYGGRMHREMRFAGVALVERPPLARVPSPETPTFDRLPTDLRPDALARAADLEEHDLQKCAAFGEWAHRTAGPPPYTEQIVRLVRGVRKRFAEKERNRAEDVCAALRQGRFTAHWAQVAIVMGARELGAPAFGFASATERGVYLVGTFTDREGWILLDIEHLEDGWFTGGAPLVTMAPQLGGFEAAQHDFWYPQGAAYSKGGWGMSTVSGTQWRGLVEKDAPPTDTTEARALRLSEVCR